MKTNKEILEDILHRNEYLGGKNAVIKALQSNDDVEIFETIKYVVAMNDYFKPGLHAAREVIAKGMD